MFVRFLLLAALLAPLAGCARETAARAGAQGQAQPDALTPPAGPQPQLPVTTVYGRGGIVATTDRVASEIGAEVLRRGGNAVDAAIAVHFALAVVNPEAGNIGGGGFMVARMAEGTTVALDFRDAAPLAATRETYAGTDGLERAMVGHLAAGVPGSVAGMVEAHRRFGSLPWAELVQPAIALADGMLVHERLAASLEANAARMSLFPSTAAIFVRDGRVFGAGERLVQADLAATLRRIARDGHAGFYSGRTAELIEAEMRRGGGLITRADLARYRAVWRDPLVFQYRGHQVISMPPPSSGGATMGAILKILEGYDLRRLGHHSLQHVHLFAEAAKRAFADRNTYLGDPDFVPQPLPRMVSADYAAERRATIRPDRATPALDVLPGLGAAPREAESTTHYSIVDGTGNAVSVTTTINDLYGSRLVVTGAGFFLNNLMSDFTLQPGVPNQWGLIQAEANAVEPGKRMLSAMTPTIVLDPAGRVRLVTGSPGGPRIITVVTQMVSNVIDWDMDLAAAIGAPRLHHQHLPDVLSYEPAGIEPGVVTALESLGHTMQIFRSSRPYWGMGDVQSISIRTDGVLVGVSDPRRGGATVAVREVD